MMQNIADTCRICLKSVEVQPVLLVKSPENYSKDYLTLVKEVIPTLEVRISIILNWSYCPLDGWSEKFISNLER